MLHNRIAWRYIVSKKSTQAINIISIVAVSGLMIGTAALIIVLSVFNGFENIISGMTGKFNPDLKITSVEGKRWTLDDNLLRNIYAVQNVESISKTLEEYVLFEFDGQQDVGILKGVDLEFTKVTALDSTLLLGYNQLNDTVRDYATLGVGLANALNIRVNDPLKSLVAYAPRRKKTSKFQKAFKSLPLTPSGVFRILQDVDNTHVFADLKATQGLLSVSEEISALEIKVRDQNLLAQTQKDIQNILGSQFTVKNRIQQDEAFYKIVNIERWVSFTLFSLIILLIGFNLVGALWMIVLDKKKDLSILRGLGMTDKNVGSIIRKAGLFMTGIGLSGGIIIAIVFNVLHQAIGIIPIPGNFIAERYPMTLSFMDVIYTTVIVIIIGLLCSWLPAQKAKRLPLSLQQTM